MLLRPLLQPLLRPLLRSPLDAAVGAAAWTPAQLTFTKGLWLDQSDITTGFQDSAGTTPQTASGQFTGKRLDKSGLGNHVLQAGATTRPEYDVISGISSDYMDGSDDGYSTATFVAGTLSSSMDLFVTIKRATTSSMIVASENPADGGQFISVITSGSGAVPNLGTGAAWSYYVDGVQIGGVGTTTRDQLNTALGSGAYHVLEIRNLDMSAWTQFTLGLYTSFMLNADIAQVVLIQAQSAANRAKLRTYVGAKGGLTL